MVIPSLPGFGFSVPLRRTGINFHRTAALWVELMRDRLGYDKFAAQGGDWGQLVTSEMGHRWSEHLIGIHLNLSLPLDFFEAALPAEDDYAPDERHWYHHTQARMAHATSHIAVQSTTRRTSPTPCTTRQRASWPGSSTDDAGGATAVATSSRGSPRTT